MQSFIARMEGDVWSPRSAICIASASKASVDLTVRIVRGARCPARMEELASETKLTYSSTAATVPSISLDDTVRITYSSQDPAPALTWSVRSTQGIKCVMPSVTTINATGMEGTAR